MVAIVAAVAVVAVAAVVVMGLLGGGPVAGLGGGVAVKGSVDEYSWAELSKISQEIGQAGSESAAIEVAKKYNLCTPDGRLDGTQTKTVTLSDGTTAQVQICGFAHDDKSDGSGKAGITFIFKDAVAEHSMNGSGYNSGGWEASEMRSWLNSGLKGQLPSDLQAVIVPVGKRTNNVGETTSASSVTVTSDALWLFSARELCGDIDWYSDQSYNSVLNAEGAQYKLFRDMNVDSYNGNAILTKNFHGSSCNWWERSANPSYSSNFLDVYSYGGPNSFDYAAYSYGVVPGFCI